MTPRVSDVEAPPEGFGYYCHTCGRKMFTADRPEVLRSRGYCSSWCRANATNGRQDSNQFRNDLWFWLTQTGRTAIYISKIDDVKAALVYKSIKGRRQGAGLVK